VYDKAQESMVKATYKAALESKNPLALQVLARARGNPTQLTAVLSSPGAFSDAKGDKIPIFPHRSYSEGLMPHEYFAATFGARQGVISTKFATREAGDLGKQLAVAAEGLIVTEEDCGTDAGIPVSIDDGDSVGALLAHGVNGYKPNAPVDSKMMGQLRKAGVDAFLVRSPITCKSHNGVCAKCAGLNEGGKFHEMGSAIGLKASSSMAERVAQGALNVKHSGGQKDAPGERVYGGFDIINQLSQVPESFRHRAALSELDGNVTDIEEAAQGGWNVTIGGQVHYVEPEQLVKVKVGDSLEAGDQISSGIVNPSEVVKHKGIGEGRRYYAQRLTQAFRDSKLTAHRRNAEVVARAVINHVDMDDEVGDYLPGDVASYSSVETTYRPRNGYVVGDPKNMVGKYLEQPALHHTIGSRVTNGMANELARFGVNSVTAHEAPPQFNARMIRLRAVPHSGDDWLAKMHSSYLMSNLLQDVQRGSESNIHGQNPVPGIVYGAEFGQSKDNQVTY
jgi:DNA-directed RNA polymerase subunit beta'